MDDRTRPHQLILDGRSRLFISGVSDVDSFDENGVVCKTSRGTLIVRGSGLRVGKLTLEGGELAVEGQVDSLAYEDAAPSGGLWSRLFG